MTLPSPGGSAVSAADKREEGELGDRGESHAHVEPASPSRSQRWRDMARKRVSKRGDGGREARGVGVYGVDPDIKDIKAFIHVFRHGVQVQQRACGGVFLVCLSVRANIQTLTYTCAYIFIYNTGCQLLGVRGHQAGRPPGDGA